MKRLLLALTLLLSLQTSHAQQPGIDERTKATEHARQVLKDFESAFSLLANPYVTNAAERTEAARRMRSSVRPDARFENDLVPGSSISKTISFDEYERMAFTRYRKSGLACLFEWEEAEFRTVAGGYLVLFYGKKSLFGSYDDLQRLQLENVRCRAGVLMQMNGKQVVHAGIAFWDTDWREKSDNTTPLTSQRHPLAYVTLPETIDELARKINRSIDRNATRKIAVEEITFDGLGISNDFSRQVTGMLKSSLAKLRSDMETDFGPGSAGPVLKIRGSYRKSGDLLTIGIQLFDHRDSPASPAIEAQILLSNISDTDIAPAESLIREALRVQAITAADQKKGRPDALLLEVVTNKGFGPQSYREGDTMTVKVRANRPCIVRMIYQDAAKNLVRLRNDDFAIAPEAVGKWVSIPEHFECAAPFGFEMLLAYATEGKFRPMEKTQSQNGFTFILDDLQNVVDLTTGSAENGQVAKEIIPITTQPRRKAF
ncbi:MAG: hypothetical protein ACO1N1_00770 [Dyadobacter fermentans]